MDNDKKVFSIERSYIERMQELLQKDPLSYAEDPNEHQYLMWYIIPVKNKEELKYLKGLIVEIGFRLTQEKYKSFEYRRIITNEIAVHISIFQFSDKHTIHAHIDVGIHGNVVRNQLTVKLLSELHFLLKHKYPTIPILLKTPPIRRRRFIHKRKRLDKSIDIFDLQNKVETVFKMTMTLVIVAAVRESLKEKEVISKERIKGIILAQIKSESSLDLDNILIRNKIEILIHQNLEYIVEKVQYGYQKQRHPQRRALREARTKLSPEIQVEPDEGYIRKRNRFDDKSALAISRYVSKEPKPLPVGEEFSEAPDYTQEIKKYVFKLNRSILTTELNSHYMDENKMRREMKNQFDHHLKTISHTSRDIYKFWYRLYLKEWFTQEYTELVNELYEEPPQEPAPNLIDMFKQWADERPLRWILIFLDIVSIFTLTYLVTNYNPSDFPFFVFMMLTFSILTYWIMIKFAIYRFKEREWEKIDSE